MNEGKRHGLAWMRRAERDLSAANKPGSFPEHVCLFSQQAAEKAIKAGLIIEGLQYPRIHDLDQLRDLLPPGWSLPNTHSDLALLSRWAVSSRYPDFADPEENPSEADAQAARKTANEVVESVKADFDRRVLMLDRPRKSNLPNH